MQPLEQCRAPCPPRGHQGVDCCGEGDREPPAGWDLQRIGAEEKKSTAKNETNVSPAAAGCQRHRVMATMEARMASYAHGADHCDAISGGQCA